MPINEIMSQNEELLLNENLPNFFNLISSVFMPSYLEALKKENNSNFFYYLSYFLEKIPDSFYDNQLVSNYIIIIQQYNNYILLNEKILFKLHFEEQVIILEQIKYFIDCSERNGFTIDIMLIINILLHYDKERYNKFCCKYHSDYFKESSEILSPELYILIKPVEKIITKLFEKFAKEASQCQSKEKGCEFGPKLFKIFEILTIDISPCLQKIIINQFLIFMKRFYGKYFGFLDRDRQMLDILLFIFKSSVFDVKIDALNLLLVMNKVSNSWTFINETIIFGQEEKIFIQNYILSFYLTGEGILNPSFSLTLDSLNNDSLFSNIR